MRVLSACVLTLGLIVSPAMIGLGRAADKDPGATGGTSSSAGAPAPNAAPTATAAPDPAAKPAPTSTDLESELQQLRELLISQAKQSQEENEALKQQLRDQQQEMLALEEKLNASNPPSANPSADSASAPAPAIGTSTGFLTDTQGPASAETPTSISFKGVTLTPGGFMAAEGVWRQHALSADVNTPFNSVPLQGSPMDHVSEFNASGRQSRISMLVEGKLANVKLGGYYEMDFLSAGVSSNYNQSDSFTMRQRQFWGQAAFDSGWTVTGGQMWSLATETRKGLDNRTEATPLTIDAAYNVGFSWLRQFGFRVTKDLNDKMWLGFSIENPETTSTFHGQLNNFLVGAPGASGGVLNPTTNFAFSATPDFIFKAAFEPGWGHYEIFGLVSTFRDRIYPCGADPVGTPCGGFVGPTGVGGFNDRRAGGGVGANARMTFFKKIDFGLHFLGGDGVGRYGAASLADVTARPDGSLAPIHNFQSLATVELHPNPKLDIYMYTGVEYEARTQYTLPATVADPNPTPFTVGYGAINLNNFGCDIEQAPLLAPSTSNPASSSGYVPSGVGGGTAFLPGALQNCTGDTRTIIEGTLGFWYRFYKGPKGTIQWGDQYSYIQRNTWQGIASGTENGTPITINGNGGPHAAENMIFTSFRYYLP